MSRLQSEPEHVNVTWPAAGVPVSVTLSVVSGLPFDCASRIDTVTVLAWAALAKSSVTPSSV